MSVTRRILDAYRRFAGLELPPAAPRTAPACSAPEAPPPAEPEAPRAILPAAVLAEPAPPAPAPRLPHPSALGGIAMLHTEHDARARRLEALHRARVAVLGTPPTGEAELSAILRRCGGRLVSSDHVRPTVWLAGDDVAPECVAALRRIGCVVVDAESLAALADEYRQTMAGSWFREAVAAAIYRLRLLERAMLLVREQPRPAADLPRRAPAPVEHGPRPAAPPPRRVQRPRAALRRVPPTSDRRSAAEDLAASIEAAARARRSVNPGCRLYDPPAA